MLPVGVGVRVAGGVVGKGLRGELNWGVHAGPGMTAVQRTDGIFNVCPVVTRKSGAARPLT